MRVYVFALVENMREYIKSNTNDKGVSLSLSLLSLQPHESTAAAGQTICA